MFIYLGLATLQTHPQAQTYLLSGHHRHDVGSESHNVTNFCWDTAPCSALFHPPAPSCTPTAISAEMLHGSTPSLCSPSQVFEPVPDSPGPFQAHNSLQMTSCLGLESTTLTSKVQVLLPLDTCPVHSQSEAMANFTSLRVPECWWWQGFRGSSHLLSGQGFTVPLVISAFVTSLQSSPSSPVRKRVPSTPKHPPFL